MPSSKAHIDASNKYNKEHYSKIQANIPHELYDSVCKFCYKTGMNKTQVIKQGCKIVIGESSNIKWSEGTFNFFVEKAALSDIEIKILKLRINGVALSRQAEILNIKADIIQKHVYRMQLMYDSIQRAYPDILPLRTRSKEEEYIDNN